MAKCKLKYCRYNDEGECINEEKRKECVEVAEAVLAESILVEDDCK